MALLLSPIAGRLADRIAERPLVMLGLSLGLEATGLLLIGALVTDSSGYRTIVGPVFIAGGGIAIAFPTVTAAVMRSAAQTRPRSRLTSATPSARSAPYSASRSPPRSSPPKAATAQPANS
jgi:MFS family permease